MADNTSLNQGAGGDAIATEDIGGVKYERVKLIDPTVGSTSPIGVGANPLYTNDFLIQVQKGQIPGHSLVHKFGEGNVGTTMVPVCQSLVYMTPSTPVALEFVSSSTADAQNGAGARQITIIGIGADWTEVTQTISTHATDGTIAVSIPTSLLRLYRWYVSSSGTYASATAGSHVGIMTIRVAGAGATWSTIPVTPFPMGQSLIGAYTIPTGKKAYLLSVEIHVESAKPVNAFLFQRPNADDVTTPYSGAMRAITYKVGLTGSYESTPRSPNSAITGPADIGFMAKVATGNSDVAVGFELLLVDV